MMRDAMLQYTGCSWISPQCPHLKMYKKQCDFIWVLKPIPIHGQRGRCSLSRGAGNIHSYFVPRFILVIYLLCVSNLVTTRRRVVTISVYYRCSKIRPIIMIN